MSLDVRDFDDVQLPDENDLDLERFSFVENDSWMDITQKAVSNALREKIRFVMNLFNEWRCIRNSVK